jgi:hypothetical protein
VSGDLVRRAVYAIKTRVAQHPALALPVARIRGHGVVVSRDSDILIEGYPRSGNTFAVVALQRAQPSPVRVAHHVHAPAHVIAAIRLGVPAMVVIRVPEDPVLGYTIWNPEVTVEQALRGYVRFHEPLVPYAHDVLIATFDEVVADFGLVVRRLNRRHRTSFVEFEHTPENVQAVFDEIEEHFKVQVGTGPQLERKVARPSEERNRLKEERREVYRGPALAPLRERAEDLYRRFAEVRRHEPPAGPS